VAIAAFLVTSSAAEGAVRKGSVFFAGVGDAGKKEAKNYAEQRIGEKGFDPDEGCPTPATVAKSVNTNRPNILVGFSYGRLGPANFIRQAVETKSSRLDDLRTVILLDPGSTDEFSSCDAMQSAKIKSAYASWLRMNKANRLLIMAGERTFDLKFEKVKLMGALSEVYLTGDLQTLTRERGRGKQVLVCNVEKDGHPFSHMDVVKSYAYLTGEISRAWNTCPSDFAGWRPNSGHPYAGRIIQRESDRRTTWTVDAKGFRHHIPNGGTYECLKKKLGAYKLLVKEAVELIDETDEASCDKPFGSGNAPAPEPPDDPPGAGGGGTPGGGGSPSAGVRSVSLGQGPVAPKGYRYAIRLSGFAAGTGVSVSCHDSVDPGGFFTFTLTTDGAGNASTESQCYSADGPDHWIVAGGVESNHVSWTMGGAPPPPPPPPPPTVWAEQQGSLGANTFTNPYNASGMGSKVQPYQWVDVSCKVHAPYIASANPDGYWYRIATAPWNNAYYAVANTFWNGDIPGQKPYTHFTDWAVPNC
jgi:hypothetical protein